MARPKKSAANSEESIDDDSPRPRLHKLTIRNFRCIGADPVEIELDDIVVLVGPNNVGKSSILRAYQVVMNHGSKEGHLTIDDFPNKKVDPNALPEIELETVVYDKAPGEKWVRTDPQTGEMYVREKWTWEKEGEPKKVGWLVEANDWSANEGPWGAANVANQRRPEPHRIEAFDSPEKQAAEIIKLLKKVLDDSIKNMKSQEGEQDTSSYATLLQQLKTVQQTVVERANGEILSVETKISETIHEVFPGYKVRFDARADEELENCISWFKASPRLLMGPENGHLSAIEHQGSGARRTLLWAALRILSEQSRTTKNDRPHLLLLDEPELCLHPDAIREACRVLYDLPKAGNWQVMVTTHSPVFIDLSRDNTSIVRVERNENGSVTSTTLFRPKRVNLDDDDRARLKMLNICDPYIAEFFFGGKTIVVEGDTEYTAFKYVIAQSPENYKNVHIIRARGKAPIVSLCKILNQFSASYSVLHDADKPKIQKKDGSEMTNPAWTQNKNIQAIISQVPDAARIRLVASLPNIEAFFGEVLDKEKPYNAILQLTQNDEVFKNVSQLLDALIDHSKELPLNAMGWSDIDVLASQVTQNVTTPVA
ncbi:MAG: ATP-dependent endonuclease [Oligoflexales bacterium]